MESLRERYTGLAVRRHQFLERAREYAKLSIPSLLPPAGGQYSKLPVPYQGFVSRASLNLASRLLTALLPPGASFFRLGVPPQALLKSQNMAVPPEVEKGLVLSEKLINAEIEAKQWRQPTSLSLLLLIVTGNVLETILPDNTIRVFRLDQYVVVRDAIGNVIEVIIHEKVSPLALPEDLRASVKAGDHSQNVDLFTCYKRDGDVFKTWQEVDDRRIEKSVGEYAITEAPFAVMRWALVPGEDYGRGKVEEHIGDIEALEGYSKSLQDGAAMAARHVWMVRPNAAGGNLRQRLAKANNGDVLSGNPEDVVFLAAAGNINAIQFIQSEIQRLTQQLAADFLMTSELRRDAERVTAYELRMLAEQLETALGGVYSLLAQEMQQTRLRRLIVQMQRNEQLPPWDGGMINVRITTGLEAIGREQDVSRVMTAGQLLQAVGQQAGEYVKWDQLLSKGFNGLQLADCVKTPQEVQQEREQAAMMQAAQAGMGQTIGAAGQAAVEQGMV